jgi:GNAT superfamily N-acetyltransferase
VSFFLDAPVPYAALDDFVVEAASRNRGIGKTIIDWVVQESKRHGCARLFVATGVDNKRARAMFERDGFDSCSVVMMKTL